MRKQCRQLQTVIWKLVIGGLTSVILVILGTVNLQFQGQFVLGWLNLGTVETYVMAICWSPCNQLLPPGEGFSTYKTTHRVWLRILSIALEEELKALDYAQLLLLIVNTIINNNNTIIAT